jgi:hypothetical protein
MLIRLIIYLIITIIFGLLFLFLPQLNIGGQYHVSLFEEMQLTGNYLSSIIRLIVETGAIFIALIFLFGLRPKTK